MPDIIQLENFFLNKLHADWVQPKRLPAEITSRVRVNYDVLRHRDEPSRFRLTLKVDVKSEAKEETAGYQITSEIVGLFSFPEGMAEDQVQALIRINGGTILYGILRGEVAAITGSFAGRKFILPTVFMPEIVKQIEGRRAKIRHPRKASKPGARAVRAANQRTKE